MERKVEVAKRYAPKGQRAAFLAEIAFSRAVGATKQLRADCMRLLLFALAAVASAQLEHSVGEALSWKSLRRAALGDKGAEQLEETLEIGGKHGGGKARGWSEMAYNKLPNAMQSVGLGQDLFRAAKKDPQLASTLKEAAVGYWKKAKGIPEPGAFPADPAAAAAAAPASAAVESKSRLRGQGRARPSP